ncbi:MAG: hypothetical protein WC755_09755 [Candidatus Woesearchaeota archaeon]|jgi:hypothetical protein
MTEERRASSLDNILLSIGELKGVLDSVHGQVAELNKKVAIQNGRVRKNEIWIGGVVMTLSFVAFLVAVFGNNIYNQIVNQRWKLTDQVAYAQQIDDKIENLKALVDSNYKIQDNDKRSFKK